MGHEIGTLLAVMGGKGFTQQSSGLTLSYPKPATVTPLRLVRTGINSQGLLLAAGGLVLGGIAIEVVRRRRRY